MIEKTGVIGGLDLPEKAEHTRETSRVAVHIHKNSIYTVSLKGIHQTHGDNFFNS